MLYRAPQLPFSRSPPPRLLALEVAPAKLEAMYAAGKARGIETRGISDHGFIRRWRPLHSLSAACHLRLARGHRSCYFRDPNGYVLELTTPVRL